MAGSGPGRPERDEHGTRPLRQAVLAVSVLDDVDLEPRSDGVVLPGTRPVLVTWATLALALGGAKPASAGGHRRLSTVLRLHGVLARLGDDALPTLEEAARALALPSGHVDHPGDAWVLDSVLGGALELGPAVVGLLGEPEEIVPLYPCVAAASGADPRAWWGRLRGHAEAMGALAAQRLARDAGAGRQSVLRPVGGCEVPTLLASRALRGYLAADGSGMRAVAVPMRSRGWYDLARVDPAFVGAAWSATAEPERAFSRPLLVTADEVSLAVPGGDPVAEALADPAAPTPLLLRDVRYR